LYARSRRFLRRILTRPRIDLPLMAALLLLAIIGLVTLYSAGDGSLALVGGQAARFVLGGALLLVVAILGEGRGSVRWLDLGVMRFQPSELLKLTMPMMVAWYLHPRQLP